MTEKKSTRDFGSEGNELYETCKHKISSIQKLRDQIIKAPLPRTVANTLNPLDEIAVQLDIGMNQCELMESVHPNEGMRTAAEISKQEMSKLASDLELDRELYDAVRALETELDDDDLLTKRFVKHVLRDFRRAGVDKSDEARARIKKLNEELVLLGQEFNRNIRSDTRYITLNDSEALEGLPADYKNAHQANSNGGIRITTDYPDFVPFMSYAKNAQARSQLYFEYSNRAYPVNEAVLTQILTKRHELATLLGYRSWASYASADKMIGGAKNIREFIDKIAAIAKKRSDTDYLALLDRKKADDPNATRVEEWEKAYYAELIRSETLGFDSQEIRPYLQYDSVKQGVLKVTSKLFDLKFQEVNEQAWHSSVEIYDILDNGEHIGRFYLDMHPRKGKYKHAAMFPIISGVMSRRLPEAALVCNFPAPSSQGQALLEHSDVVTFFHEFGHLLHHILGGRQRWVRFSGVATEWDFVEVPSQLLEEWAYQYETLKDFAVHCETKQSIPKEMVENLNKARSFGRGVRMTQQMFYAALSLNYHDTDPSGIDTTETLKTLQKIFSPFSHVEGTHLQTSFGHLEGYSALYYTYMWSLVIARDLFDQFSGNMFDTELAVRYRKSILEPGGARDATELIQDFLGRDYSLDAYERWVKS